MHTNALTVTEAVDYMMRETPYWTDDMVAWSDCDLYLRQPGYGIGYLMGADTPHIGRADPGDPVLCGSRSRR